MCHGLMRDIRDGLERHTRITRVPVPSGLLAEGFQFKNHMTIKL